MKAIYLAGAESRRPLEHQLHGQLARDLKSNVDGDTDVAVSREFSYVAFASAMRTQAPSTMSRATLANGPEVIAEVSNEYLSVGWMFSREAHRELTTDRGLAGFEQDLTTIVAPCVALRRWPEPIPQASVECC